MNGEWRGASGGLTEFFGDGSDGSLNLTTDLTIGVTSDTDLIVKEYSDVYIGSGVTLTVDNPCSGLVLYSKSDIVVDGTISMSLKSGPGGGQLPPIPLSKDDDLKINMLLSELATLKGGAGGNGGYSGEYARYDVVYNGKDGGTGGAGRICGGGYGGGGAGGGGGSGNASYGGSITSPNLRQTGMTYNGDIDNNDENGRDGSGGSGGSGGSEGASSSYACRGGSGAGCVGGGGGGGGGAWSDSASGGNEGEPAGGFILLIAKGNITINGTLAANGGKGGNGGNGDSYSGYNGAGAGGGGGGGAGGGVIAIYHKGSFTNNGTITVNGGSGGTKGYTAMSTTQVSPSQNGYPGSSGTIFIKSL